MANLLTDYSNAMFDIETLTRDIKAAVRKITKKKTKVRITMFGEVYADGKLIDNYELFDYVPYAQQKTIDQLLEENAEDRILAILSAKTKRKITSYVYEIYERTILFHCTNQYKKTYDMILSRYARY